MDRHLDWPERLRLTVMEARTRAFEWGVHDCALFAANAVLAMTGTDMAAGFRDKYKTARGAAGTIKRYAGGGLEELADKIAASHDLESVAVAFARRGDVVLLDLPDGPALGVVTGAEAAFAGPDGLSLHPVSACRRAWRI